MTEELSDIIEQIKDQYDKKEDQVKVIYTESDVMHTVRVGETIYKAIKVNESWKIMEMR